MNRGALGAAGPCGWNVRKYWTAAIYRRGNVELHFVPFKDGKLVIVYNEDEMVNGTVYTELVTKGSNEQVEMNHPQPNFYATHYRSGEEIRSGDRIDWAGKPGYVVFVLGSATFPDDWSDSIAWFVERYQEGFMLDTEIAGLIFKHESDEDLEFIARNA